MLYRGFRDSLRRAGVEIRDSTEDKNEIRISCPFCNEDRFRLGINVKKDLAQCFNCNWKSRHAKEAIIHRLKLKPSILDDIEQEHEEEKPFELPRRMQLLHKHYNDSMWTKRALLYLIERGIGTDLVREKKVLFTESGRYAYRAVFPVIYQEAVVGIVGRAITKSQTPKYLNSTGTKYIWNIPDTPKKRVILCEGVFKAIAIENVFDSDISVGALLGHTITPNQIQQLQGAQEIVLFPDPDEAGINGMIKVAYKLQNEFKVVLPATIPTLQADELTPENILQSCLSLRLFSQSIRCLYQYQALRRRK